MTLTWAWAETSLAMAIGIINREIEPIKGHPEPPLSLKNRVACFKVALRDIAALKPLQEEGRGVAKRFTELSKRRNAFIHGAAWEHQEGGFEAMGIRVTGGENTIQNHRFDQSDAALLTSEIAKLQDDMASLLLAIAVIPQR